MVEDPFVTAMSPPELSIVIPFLNEEQVLPLFARAIAKDTKSASYLGNSL